MTTRDPARLRRLDPAGKGGRQGRRPGRLATRGGVAAAVLIGVLLTMVVLGRLPGATAIPGLLPVALVAAVAWPASAWVAGRSAAARRLAIRREAAPAVLDLLGAALLAGLNPHKAVLRVAERAPDVLHQDLGLAAAVLRLGGTPAAALRAAADRSGLDELRAAAAALEAAERWGAPPAEALAARAEALRSRARLHAEAEAGRAAVRLAFPLVLCFLPAFVLTNVELRLQFSELVPALLPATVVLLCSFDRELPRASTKRDCELIEEPDLPQEDLPRRACPLREEVNLCLPLDVTLPLLGS
jgi:Flp pilus assembly protein TadB